MARTHVGTTLFVTLASDHVSRSTRRKSVTKKAVGPPHKKYRCVKQVKPIYRATMTASLLVRTFSHLAVSCFVHRSRQTKQPEDDMRECLCPKPSHTTVPVSLKRQPHALRPRKIQQFLGSETLGKISLTPGDAAKH
jgi:hypothetical protein